MDPGTRRRPGRSEWQPVLCKETGLPSGGAERFSPERQRDFWRELTVEAAKAKEQPIAFVAFEAFDWPGRPRSPSCRQRAIGACGTPSASPSLR